MEEVDRKGRQKTQIVDRKGGQETLKGGQKILNESQNDTQNDTQKGKE